jgi:hypothetical protein
VLLNEINFSALNITQNLIRTTKVIMSGEKVISCTQVVVAYLNIYYPSILVDNLMKIAKI